MNFNVRQKKVINATEPNIICLAAAGSGKSIPNSTIIPTPNGWRKVSEIKKGDFLFDQDGNPTKVLGVFPQGKKEVYEITFGDKRTAKCCIDHIWSVHKDTWKDKDKFKDYTLKEILEDKWEKIDARGHKSHIFSIPCSKAVKYNVTQELTVDPYLLGVFLGDGSCLESGLTLSSNDKEIVEKIQLILECPEVYQNTANYHWNFYKNNRHQRIKTEEIFGEYAENVCCYSYEKSIPEAYKLASIEDRYKLIQGLMDTDGSITKADGRYHVKFTTTSEKLKDDFIEVMGSLGYICSYRIDSRREKYTAGKAYEIKINIPNSEKYKLFSLSRKKNIAKECIDKPQHRRYDRTTITNIRDLGYEEEMTCFYVDNEKHLFLMNDYIVTHNTSCLTERIRTIIQNGCSPDKIVAITFTTMAAEEMKKRLGDIAEGAFIGTIHSYANAICIANGISTEKYVADAEFDKIIEKVLTIPIKRYFPVTHLLVDEFQDTGSLEYRFIERIPTENRFYIGDERQAIYGFKGCSDEFLRMCHADISFTTYYLNQNYRCAPNILAYADSYLNTMEKISLKSEAVKTKNGIVEEDSTLLDAIEELEWTGDYQNWAIICRTNNELAAAVDFLDKRKIPNLSFKKGDLDLVEMEGLLRENKVKVLTIHTAKGLEFKKVIVIGAKTFNEEERKISYVAATRAEQALYCCPSICKRGKKGRPQNRDIAEAGKIIQQMAKNNIVF